MTSDVKQPQMTLGTMIDQMYGIRTQRAEIAAKDKALTAEFKALEVLVMEALDAQDTIQSRGKTASATITEETVAQIEDWDQVYQFIKDTDSFFLLQRRFNNAPWRELDEAGEHVPGTASVKVRSISVRKS